MSLRAEISTTLCAVGCALGIGYVMQSGDAAELRYGGKGHGLLAQGYFVGEPPQPGVDKVMSPTLHDTTLDDAEIQLTSAPINAAGLSGQFDPAKTNNNVTVEDETSANLSTCETADPRCPHRELDATDSP